MSSLVICEKALQAEKVRKAVGNQYGRVVAASGHLLRLEHPEEADPEQWTKWSTALLWNGKLYRRQIGAGEKCGRLLKEIKEAAAGVDQIVIATDPDREGQVIGDEIVQWLRFRGKVMRVTILAEDPESLRDAFRKMRPNSEFAGVSNSGEARAQADQVSNLSLTRAATVLLKAPDSAPGAIGIGRVKTPVMAIICTRDEEIANFKPRDFFSVDAKIETPPGKPGGFSLTCRNMPSNLRGEPAEDDVQVEEDDAALTIAGAADPLDGKIVDKALAQALATAARGFEGPISAQRTKGARKPPKLYDLTSLQKIMSARRGWSASKTLEVTQSLYSTHEIVTYPRSEAQYLPEAAIPDVPRLLRGLLALDNYTSFTGLLASPEPRTGKSGHFCDAALAGKSHYAIVPNVNTAHLFADKLSKLSNDEAYLFDVIARSYLAALAPDYRFESTKLGMVVPFRGANWHFRASGETPVFDGWRAILSAPASKSKDKSDEAPKLPAIADGARGRMAETAVIASQTKPPSLYTEGAFATVMKEAWRFVADPALREKLKESEGIGQPSTRAKVIDGLVDQGLIARSGKFLTSTGAGMALWRLLREIDPDVVDPGRTAMWETIFSLVEQGRLNVIEAVEKIARATKATIAKLEAGAGPNGFGYLPMAGRPAYKGGSTRGGKGPGKSSGKSYGKSYGNGSDASSGAANAGAPSEKQVGYAQSIAAKKKIEIPAAALKDKRVMSEWIDKHAK